MRIIFITLIIIFSSSLFAQDGEQKYNKVLSSIEKHYYQAFSKDEIISKGVNKLLETTPLLTLQEKKKINIKFKYYDNEYGVDSKKSVDKKIKIIIEFLSKHVIYKEEIYNILIHSTMQSLDVHSSYLDKKHMQELTIYTEGAFGGLGIGISKKKKALIIISLIDNSPAFKAGIKVGDKIIKINEISCEHIPLNKAVTLMRGKVNTSVNLTIDRNNKIIPVTIVRDFIKIKSVYSKKLPNDLLYLKITTFDKNVLENITKAIDKNLLSSGAIILDVRNNPGGFTTQAVGIADLFISRGNIITQKGRSSITQKSYNASKEKTLTDVPLVVLINAGSASASEILSGALQMHHRATLIGERSFGKGNIQEILTLNEEESIKLTVAQYFLADGNSIHNIGIKPDYTINTDIIDGYDIALEAAEDYLNNKTIFNKKYFTQAYGSAMEHKRFRHQDIDKKLDFK